MIGSVPAVFHEPGFSGNEWLYIKECIDSTFVSSVGKFVDRFECDLAAYARARYSVAVVKRYGPPCMDLMQELMPFRSCPLVDLAGAKSLVQRLINIPSSSNIQHQTVS